MLYLFTGTDTAKIKNRARAVIDSLLQRKPDASLITISEENFSPALIEEALYSRGLFEQNYIVIWDHLSRLPAENWQTVKNYLEPAAQSPHIFVCLEEKLKTKDKQLFERLAQQSEEHLLPAQPVAEFNVFSLTEAVAGRDRGQAWPLFHQALKAGKSPEELFGLLHWQLKVLNLAQQCSGAKEAELKPFVYQKARRAAGRFTGPELETYWQRLLDAYHRSRQGERTLEEELELFILTL